MKLFAVIGMAFAAMVLQGCASITGELVEKEGAKQSAVVQLPIQTAYANLVEAARACVARGGLTLESDLPLDGKAARVAASFITSGAPSTIVVTRLQAEGPTQTRLASSFYVPAVNPDAWQWLADNMSEWANGRPGKCRWQN